MGLEGYLEDLGISEILQIISLSKKSGTLSLINDKEAGTITFLDGQVVRATSTQYPETLGQLLTRSKLATAEQIELALAKQVELKNHLPLGALLSSVCNIQIEDIETIVKLQIEKIVYSFFTWGRGSFSFQLGDQKPFGSTAVNPFDFMLEKGVSSQRLLVKGQCYAGLQDAADSTDDAALEKKIEYLENRLDDQGMTLLRGMLAELENPYLGGGIILLILRYASEIMNRAIIFDVRGRQLVGLGQFGLMNLSEAADDIVRKMRLTVDQDSLFYRVLYEKSAVCAALRKSTAERTLIEVLGGTPAKVFLGPLVSDGKVVAMLYGDNYPADDPIESAGTFEVFLSQAGLAMEQALQEH
jgi:hypothetical protein